MLLIKKFRQSKLLPWLSLLSLVCAIIFLRNFPFGTWYTGWDNLHPEFNFPLNFTRALSSVWQANQGLGTYGGHGYASTLPHTITLWFLSFFLPQQYLRSTFTFLMLFVGIYGVFFLGRELLKEKGEKIKNSAATLGALFYLFNLATAQQFYIQLEPFIVHYAVLPWLFFSLLRYLEKGTWKIFWIFVGVSLFSTIQGFIPPLFFVYLLLLSIFLGTYLFYKPSVLKLKKIFVILGATLLLNAYWFGPVAYFTVTRSGTYLNAYNNLSSTEDFILKNKKYGTIENVVILKGFIFEAIDATNKGDVFPIFAPWEQHLTLPVKIAGYSLFGIVLFGLVQTFLGSKRKYTTLALAAGFFIIFSLLATNVPPFSYISHLLQEIPIAKQAFRVAFTKFSIALSFLYALLFVFGAAAIFSILEKYRPARLLKTASFTILAALLIWFGWPNLTGKLLYDRTKLNIPSSYFELFDFFKNQDSSERIANFPQGWNWGWSVYRWGYSGSGFLWYGVKQPILDRAFDVWGKHNEDYFWQLSYAIYSEKFFLIDNMVDKYHISWLILDKNIIPYANPRSYLYTEKVEGYLNSNPKYEKIKTFSSSLPGVRDVFVYKVLKTILPAGKIPNIQPLYNYTYLDLAYLQHGSYFTSPDSAWSFYYPYRSLLTSRKLDELPVTIQDKGDYFDFMSQLPDEVSAQPVKYDDHEAKILDSKAKVVQDGKTVTVSVPKSNSLETYLSKSDPYFLNHKAFPCSTPALNGRFSQATVEKNVLRFESKNADNCYSIIMDKLENKYAYLVKVDSRHIKGKALELAVLNPNSRKPDIDVFLPNHSLFQSNYLLIPSGKFDGVGYNLNFNNVSIGSDETINDLQSVEVYPIPYEFLSNLVIANPNLTSPLNNFFVFHQSFDPGWRAFVFSDTPTFFDKTFPFVRGKQLSGHVIFNNWENAWDTNSVSTANVVTTFIPQYIEYAGLIVLFTAIVLGLVVQYTRKPK